MEDRIYEWLESMLTEASVRIGAMSMNTGVTIDDEVSKVISSFSTEDIKIVSTPGDCQCYSNVQSFTFTGALAPILVTAPRSVGEALVIGERLKGLSWSIIANCELLKVFLGIV